MATHSSILAWEIPWTEEPGGLQSVALQESDTIWQLNNISMYNKNKTSAKKKKKKRNDISTLTEMVYVHPSQSISKILIKDKMVEKEMATHSSILAWEIPLTKEAGWVPLQKNLT